MSTGEARETPSMGNDSKLVTVVFGIFAALGVVTAVIAGVTASLTDGDAKSAFTTVALVAIVLAVVTGYVALAAWRQWWPLRSTD
jgi:hypothetical protein